MAVVEQDPILSSDLEQQARQAAASTSIQDSVVKRRTRKVLAQLVEKQVILAEAARLGITVPPKDVNEAVDQEIAQVKSAWAETLGFQQALAQETTEPALRKRYEPDVRDQLVIMRTVGREVQNKINVTDAEVRAYYQANHDSIGSVPRRSARAHPGRLRARLPAGAPRPLARGQPPQRPLETGNAARSRSWRPASRTIRAAAGGLGPFGRGDMVPEFEDGVPAQADGDLRPVRTRFGYHVIQVIEHFPKNDTEEARARTPHRDRDPSLPGGRGARPRQGAGYRAIQLARGADFAGMVRRHSADAASRDSGGSLGEIPV